MDVDNISYRDSSTINESKEFLMESEQDHSVLPLNKRKNKSIFNGKIILLALNILFLISAVAVWANVHVLLRNFRCDGEKKQDHFEADLLFDTPVTFQPHHYYGGMPSNKTDEMWQRLSPPGDGIVEVPNEFTIHLPASLPAPHKLETHKVYGVSMFHQLHCLNFLRFAYYPETVMDMPPSEITAHRDHCLDYIRQAIMCAGDSTFEPLTVVGINGMGATHECRSYEKIFSWAYDHRSDKIEGSGYTDGVVTHTPGHRNDFVEDGP